MPLVGGLFIEERGQGPAVALLHGSPTATRVFRGLVERLARSRRVLVPELPGYGRSPALEPGAPLSRGQELLEEALRACGASEVALVGFSLGGYRAIDLALRGRLRATALVTIGGYAGLAPAHADGLRAIAAQVRAMRDFQEPAFRRGVAQLMISPACAARAPEVLEEIEQWLDVVSPAALADELLAAVDAPDLTPRLGALDLPARVLVGALDASTPLAYSQALAAGIRGAQLEIFAGCGHTLMLEEPGRLSDAVAAALGAA